MKKKWIVIIGIAALVLLALGIKFKSKPEGKLIDEAKVEKRTIKELVSASGKIYPTVEVNISSDVSGEIVELKIEEGDSVRQGQVLAKIDPESYQSIVLQARASVNSAKSQLAMSRSNVSANEAQKEQIEAQLMQAQTVHNRNITLKDQGVISDVEFEQSLANLNNLLANKRAAEASIESSIQTAKAAEFAIENAEAQLDEFQTNLNRTTIKAPMDGTISLLNVEQGERVVGTIQMAGTEMMRIADFSQMEVHVEVSENDILKVNVGNSVDIEVDSYLDQTFKGYVTEIGNSASNIAQSGITGNLNTDQITNFIVKIRIEPESYQDLSKRFKFPFRPGMSASVEILSNTIEDALTIPIQAVTVRDLDKDDGIEKLEPVVFLHQGDSVIVQKVEPGIQDDYYIQILDGLALDQSVVEGPYSTISKELESGDKVRIESKDEKK